MERITLADAIAIIGCITGVCGFIISLFTLWNNRYCLKAEFVPDECIFFDPITKQKYSSSKQAIVHITLRNKSTSPLTVHDAYIMVNHRYTRFEQYTDSEYFSLPNFKPSEKPSRFIDECHFINIPMHRQLIFPLRLGARDSVECIGFIPLFPYDNDSCVKVTLVLKTAVRKKHKIRFRISNYCYKAIKENIR